MTPTKILEIYRRRQTIKATAREAGCSEGVVRKVLVGAGIIKTPLTERIAELRNAGMTQSDIAELLGLSDTCINVNTPYIGKSYLDKNKTLNAIRIAKWRKRKKENIQNGKKISLAAI